MRGAPADAVRRARQLRREQTDAERRLWRHLRGRAVAQAKFRRQEPIGKYYADFCSVEMKLIIEVDGGQHADSREEDEVRTQFLKRSGYRVLRLWNNDVLANLDGVLGCIAATVAEQRTKMRGEKTSLNPLT